jgi:hypothetical protein
MSGVSGSPGGRRRRWALVRVPKTPEKPPTPSRPDPRRRQLALILVGLAALLLAGLVVLLSATWGARPRAPALIDEPVYHNAREGFRFLVPEGWAIHARGEPPPGRVDKERLLVNYQRTGSEKPAFFEVTLADLPPATDLAAHLAGPSYGSESWRQKTLPETLDVGGVAATRFVATSRVGKDDLTKETVAVRRGERVYFFTAVYTSGDTAVREQLRRTVGSLIWKP